MKVRPDTTASGHGQSSVDKALADLAGAEPCAAAAARADLVTVATDRMRALAHRMLAGSARVRRWEETDDVVQGAMLRLHRALGSVVPNDTQHFLRLAALQVRRELLDLARRHGCADSFAANHETNSLPGGNGGQQVDWAEDHASEPVDHLADWARFHELAEDLPDDQRELFDMVWYIGLSQDEIANLLGCSTRTVRRRWEETKRRFSDVFRGSPPK